MPCLRERLKKDSKVKQLRFSVRYIVLFSTSYLAVSERTLSQDPCFLQSWTPENRPVPHTPTLLLVKAAKEDRNLSKLWAM